MIIGISGKMQSGKDTVGKIIQYLISNYKDDLELKENTYHPYSEEDFKAFLKCDGYSHSGWEVRKFADKLKDIVCLLIGCTREQLEDINFKNKELGKEWIRYGKADGFFHTSNGPIMNNAPRSKEEYEEELRINWQTAYKLHHTPRTILQLFGTQCGRFVHKDIWINALFVDYKPIDLSLRQSMLSVINYSECFPNWIITDVRFPNEAEAIKSRGGILIRVNRNIKNSSNHNSEIALDNYSNWDYVLNNNGSIEELITKVKLILTEEKICLK